MHEKFRALLYRAEKPARYVGGEYNLPNLKKPHAVSFCIAFPDLYEVAMSNLGVQLMYDILNRRKDTVCERCFAPWVDMGALLKEHHLPLPSIETNKPLADFDAVGFSVQYELSYTNILYMLDLAGIPFYASERGEAYPILLAGGPCTANPEPFAAFFDVICIGDGEEFIGEFAALLAEYKGKPKKEFLLAASKIAGAYVPALSQMRDGVAVTPVKKAVVTDLNAAPYIENPIVPNLEIVHDRQVIELFRGCHAGCRFCQACFFYRPIRVRSEDNVVNIAQNLMRKTGAEEVGFSSLSSGDYPHIKSALTRVMRLAEGENVKVQLPSLRLDSFSAEITKGARKSSLTFAPEAGTQRLRDVINKNITEADIERTMRAAFAEGYRSIKLYFMVGLPTETEADVLGIPALVKWIQDIYFEEKNNRSLQISVSTSVFVPKPVTPFQWAAQLPVEEMARRQRLLRTALKSMRGVSYHWSEESQSFLEGVFARGGRDLAGVVEAAYRAGAYFDGWSERYNFSLWEGAIASTGIEAARYTGAQPLDAALPWDYIDFGVERSYLAAEYARALKGETSFGCKEGCTGCGANVFCACDSLKGGEGVCG